MTLSPTSSRGSTGVPVLVGCKVYNSTTQSINSGANTAVTFDSEEYDTSSFHEGVTNPSRITFASAGAGYYLVTFGAFWNSAGGTSCHIVLKMNNTTLIRGSSDNTAVNIAGYAGAVSVVVAALVTDYLEVIAFQNSGGPINLGHASALDAQATLTCTLLGT